MTIKIKSGGDPKWREREISRRQEGESYSRGFGSVSEIMRSMLTTCGSCGAITGGQIEELIEPHRSNCTERLQGTVPPPCDDEDDAALVEAEDEEARIWANDCAEPGIDRAYIEGE